MAVAVAAAEFVGFSHSYRERVASGFILSRAAELHIILFVGWILLFVVQTSLVKARLMSLHRRLGVVAAAWAAVMVVTGVPLAIGLARRGGGLGATDPLAFLLVMATDLLVFCAFVAAGIVLRHRSETHKRLMLLATIALLPPGVGRWPIAGANPAPVVATVLVAFLAAAPLADRLAGRRMHPASLWGGVALLLSVPVRFALAQTAAWHHVATWLTR